MNKTELVAAIAEKTELSKKDAEKALKAFTDVVTEELTKGGKIQLVGFGTFEVSCFLVTTITYFFAGATSNSALSVVPTGNVIEVPLIKTFPIFPSPKASCIVILFFKSPVA